METKRNITISICRIILTALIFVLATPTQAQIRKLNPAIIADMLIKEKASGIISNEPFVNYLDSIGFKPRGGNRLVLETFGRPMKVEFLTDEYDKSIDRRIRIYIDDHHTCWWMTLKLKEFGLRESGHDGEGIFLKGKGLHAMCLPYCVWISYNLKMK